MKSRGHHRPERVATLIQQILGQTLTTGIKDPRVGFVTVTGVSVSADLSHATARVSILGDDQRKADALAALQHASGYLRSVLAKSMDLRTTPELHFVIDRGLEHARHIDDLLDQIDQQERES